MTESDWQRVRQHHVEYQKKRDAPLLDRASIARRQREGIENRDQNPNREWGNGDFRSDIRPFFEEVDR